MSQTPQNADLDKAFEALKSTRSATIRRRSRARSRRRSWPCRGTWRVARRSNGASRRRSPPPIRHVARSFVCRQLALIGTPASVRALAPLVLDEELSVHARNALERIPGAESEKAFRDALGQAKGRTRIGVINSVAARRDAASTPVLIKILGEDPESAAAAAKALGEIGTSEAAKALAAARGKGPAPVQQAVVDGTLICADRLVAAGQRSQAITLLEGLTEASQPEHVRLAAQRALSAVTRK